MWKRNNQGYHEVCGVFNLANNLFIACFIIISMFIAWSVIIHTVEGLVMFTITLVFLIAWFAQPKRTWLYLIFLIAVSFGIKYYTIVNLLPPPIQDFKTVLDAAQGLLRGDTGFNRLKYFYDWAYQTPFVLYDYFILKIKDDIQAIKFVNVLMSVGINVLIYLTLKGSVKERYAKAVATVFAFMPFPAVMNTWLSNQPAAALFTYLGLYLFVKKGKIITGDLTRLMAAGFIVGIGNLIRPEGIIVLAAVGVWLLFEWFKDFDADGAMQFVVRTAAFMVPYLLVGVIVSALVVASGVNPHGIKNNNPYWKFTLGLNHQAKGMWNKEDYDWLAEQEAASDASVKEIQMPLIKYRAFSDPGLLPELFADKSHIFWATPRLYPAFEYLKEGDDDLNLSQEDLKRYKQEREYYLAYLNKADVWLFLMMAGIAALGCFEIGRSQSRQKESEHEGNYVFALFIFATAMVYLLIEVQPRYVYVVQPAVMILAAYGLQFFGGKEKSD